MVVEGVGVKKEKRRHPESTDLGARRDKGGICPCSGSRKWPLNRRLELEEQEVGARRTGGIYSLRGKFQSARISLS